MMRGVIEHYKSARTELTAPGSPFEVVRQTVMGSDILVYKAAPPNVRLIWESTAAHGDKDYVVYEDERYSYADIHAQVRKLADYLVDHGAVRGTRVALAMRNYPEWVVGYWACVSIGVAAVGMNAWWTAPEMEYALDTIVTFASRTRHAPEQTSCKRCVRSSRGSVTRVRGGGRRGDRFDDELEAAATAVGEGVPAP